MEVTLDEQTAWHALITLAKAEPPAAGPISAHRDDLTTQDLSNLFRCADLAARRLLEIYLPLCQGTPARFVVAHLGQSLDGRIAAANGASRWVTGAADLIHNHRMRALFQAVVVGAGTVEQDDPQLTVRAVPGPNPVRVVLDARRRLPASHRLFTDAAAPTLVLCDQAFAAGAPPSNAEVVGLPCAPDGTLEPRRILDLLAARGLSRVFVEGGGITVSRFLAAGCLHRLQLAVAPVIIGSGRPSIGLPEVDRIDAALRPKLRRVDLGEDTMFECRFDG